MTDLPGRFEAHLGERGWVSSGDLVIVACSGGLDSLSFLHLVHFALPGLGLRVEAAHFDHGMRAASGEDARWLSGLAAAWGIPLHAERASEAPGTESEARDLRYAFLEDVRVRTGARWVVTAHHADDQVETILFRLARGSGLEGLRGIPEVREPGILRPLLPFARAEIAAYARKWKLRPREDSTNHSLRFARNRVRHELLPLLERIHPGARESVLRLARHAADAALLLDRFMEPLVQSVVLERWSDGLKIDRGRFLALGGEERTEVFRRLSASIGLVPSVSGTEATLQFMTRGSSGGEVRFSGDVTLRRSFDQFTLERGAPSRHGDEVHESRDPVGGGAREGRFRIGRRASRSLEIPSVTAGRGAFACSGRDYEAHWGVGLAEGAGGEEPAWQWAAFSPSELAFPLQLRSWQDGDRTRTFGGGKKLKKLFGELRIPKEERGRLPLLVDAEEVVIWIAGRHQAPADQVWREGGPTPGALGSEEPWHVGVRCVGGD